MMSTRAAGFWAETGSRLELNPRMPEAQAEALSRAWQDVGTRRFPSCIGFATSGSSGGPGKIVALSRAALEASARAVNQALEAGPSDRWFKTLPSFHVGGFGILLRAELSGAAAIDASHEKWSASVFAQRLSESSATLTSLVPAQVFDLVGAGLRPPASLRAVLVGGGALADELALRARKLGWPILPSYGMTECGSTIAACPLAAALSGSELRLRLLAHVEAAIADDGRLRLKSDASLDGYVSFDSNGHARAWDPKHDAWFTTEDRAELDGPWLLPLGRDEDFIKIGGEQSSFARLEAALERAKLECGADLDVALAAIPDERLGAAIVLLFARGDAAAQPGALGAVVRAYEAHVHPFERARAMVPCEAVPRSSLGKVLRAEARAIGAAWAGGSE